MLRLRILVGAAILAGQVGASAPGLAQGTPQQRAACTDDALRLCAAEVPNVSRITSCMKANFSRLSAGCKAVFHYRG